MEIFSMQCFAGLGFERYLKVRLDQALKRKQSSDSVGDRVSFGEACAVSSFFVT